LVSFPKISILIPAYNEEDVIEDCLNHAINEMEYPNKEVILGIDDGTDSTHDIAKAFQKKYPQLIIHYSPVRGGVAKNMDRILKLATGDIIFKNDADVRSLNPKKCLYELAKEYEDPKVGGVMCFMDFVDKFKDEKNLVTRAEYIINILGTHYTKKFYPLEKRPWIPISIHSFRRSIISGVEDADKVIHDDTYFAYKVLDSGHKITYCKETWFFLGAMSKVKDLFKQKRKGVVGWMGFENGPNMKKYYATLFFYFFKAAVKFKFGFRDFLAFFMWCFVFVGVYISSTIKGYTEPTKIWWRGYKRQ